MTDEATQEPEAREESPFRTKPIKSRGRRRSPEAPSTSTSPVPGLTTCRQRLAPAHFNRATVIAEVYDPGLAVTAGFLDRVVSTTELSGTARDVAGQLRALDLDAHLATKLRARGKALAAVREAIRPGLR